MTFDKNIRVFFCSGSDLSDLQCMLRRDDTRLWVAGHQNLMLEVDLKKGVVCKKVTARVRMSLSFSKYLLLFLRHLSFCLKIDDVTMATILPPGLFHAGFTFPVVVLIKHCSPVMRWLRDVR